MTIENLNLKVENNHILNVEELILEIKSLEYNFNNYEFLQILSNNLRFRAYDNKDELERIVNSKISEFKKERHLDNIDVLKHLQQRNSQLYELSIIETTSLQNDSKRAIDYLAYSEKDQPIDIAICPPDTGLGAFFDKYPELADNADSKTVFNRFKEYTHVDLDFYPLESFEDDQPNLAAYSVVSDPSIKRQELEELKDYVVINDLEGNLEVTVDSYGERIYRVGKTLIKFTTDTNNNRHLISLTTAPTTEFTFDIEHFKNLVSKHQSSEIPLTIKESTYLDHAIDYIFDTLSKNTVDNDIKEGLIAALNEYILPLVEIYNKEQEGLEGTLTNHERYHVEQYLIYQNTVKNTQSLKPPKKKLKKNNTSSGIANVLILAELTTVGILLTLLLSIAK